MLQDGFESTLPANKNQGRSSDIVAVIFPDIVLKESILEKNIINE